MFAGAAADPTTCPKVSVQPARTAQGRAAISRWRRFGDPCRVMCCQLGKGRGTHIEHGSLSQRHGAVRVGVTLYAQIATQALDQIGFASSAGSQPDYRPSQLSILTITGVLEGTPNYISTDPLLNAEWLRPDFARFVPPLPELLVLPTGRTWRGLVNSKVSASYALAGLQRS